MDGFKRLEPQKGGYHQRHFDFGFVCALRFGLQRVKRCAAARRRQHDYGFGGLYRQQQHFAARLTCVSCVLHFALRLGLEKLPQGGQHRRGTEVPELDSRLCFLHSADYRARDIHSRVYRKILPAVNRRLKSENFVRGAARAPHYF